MPAGKSNRPESNMLKSLLKMLPKISPIMLLSAPIMHALCSQVANNSW